MRVGGGESGLITFPCNCKLDCKGRILNISERRAYQLITHKGAKMKWLVLGNTG